MKTKLTALLLAAALALTLAACGEKDIADTPLPDEPPEPVAEQPAADDEWIVLHADDVLLHEEPFTLCEGRTATLRLYGRQDGEYDCGVSRILLLWDDGGEQELRTADVGDDVWCTDGYTNCWTEDGGLAIGDYNFDGYMDLGLQIDTPAYNLPYYYWFYDAETASFSLMAAGPISLRSMRKMRRASASGMPRPSITPTPTVPMGRAGCTSRGATRRFTTARTG